MDNLAGKHIDSQDEIFFYIRGHGASDNSKSMVDLDFKVTSDYLGSPHFRDKMDQLYIESITNKIGFLVESCKSGYFVENFNIPDPDTYINHYPFLAMSSSNAEKNSLFSWATGKPVFSDCFWFRVALGDNALEAFEFARDHHDDSLLAPNQYPQINDETYHGYIFFDN